MTEATRAAAFDDLLTKDELASAIGVSPKTVERWMRKGLPYIKFSRAVRFRRVAFEEWMRTLERSDKP
jgi:excisionase family DNA binding protein